MTRRKVRGANSVFIAFLRVTAGKLLKSYFNIKHENAEIKGLKAPFIVLGNHTNNLDPFMMAAGVHVPVHFVASDEYFRKPVLRFLLGLVGAIPKVKLTADVNSVNNIKSLIEAKRAIGIYPEGSRNWDGNTLDVLMPTAKLIKRLGVPVVAAVSRGAYFSWPRWANTLRRGEITIHYEVILSEKDIVEKSSVEIYSIINKALAHDEYKAQREVMKPFRGKALAEHLELFLYACPECHSIGSLKSEGEKLSCEKCGYTVKPDEYGFFKSDGKLHFDNPADWGKWQKEWMTEKLKEAALSEDNPKGELLIDEVLVKVGEKASPLKDFGEGAITLCPKEIKFEGNNQELVFEIKKIRGINVQYNSLFEFYYENVLYRFLFKTKYVSAYKWVEAVEIIKSMR